jgi:hypothetical protein
VNSLLPLVGLVVVVAILWASTFWWNRRRIVADLARRGALLEELRWRPLAGGVPASRRRLHTYAVSYRTSDGRRRGALCSTGLTGPLSWSAEEGVAAGNPPTGTAEAIAAGSPPVDDFDSLRGRI